MPTPSVYLMECSDASCGVYLAKVGTTRCYVIAKVFLTRNLALEGAVKMGWYIGDEELCPECAEKRGKHGNT